MTDSLIVPHDSGTLYLPYPTASDRKQFPDRIFDKKLYDTMTVRNYSAFLFSLKEPILCNYSGKQDIFRFCWFRAFDPTIFIRLEKNIDKVKLNLKVFGEEKGNSGDLIAIDTTVDLSKKNWNAFVSLIDSVRFWKIPSNDYVEMLDGSSFFLEGVQNQQYHWVKRLSLGDGSSFTLVCQYLISIAPISIDPKKIY